MAYFCIFHILAHPAAFVSTWLDIEISVTLYMLFTPGRREILQFTYHKFNTGIYNEVATERGRTITATAMKTEPIAATAMKTEPIAAQQS